MAIAKGTEVWRGQMRLPKPMAEWLRVRAAVNFRTVNGELMEVVREAMQRDREAKHAQPAA